MKKEELITKLQDIEWEDFEVKKAQKSVPKNCWETVSAFSNTSGGWLIYGVSQLKEELIIEGVEDVEKMEQDFTTTLRSGQKFNVLINPICRKYEIDGKNILAFYIYVAAEKPVYFNNIKNTFIRRTSGDQRATQAEIDAMYRDQAFGSKDKELTQFCKDSLNIKSITRYRNFLTNMSPTHIYNRISEDEFLQKLQVIKDGKVTIAGLLFFGQSEKIEEIIPDFRIDYLEIPGATISEAIARYNFRLEQQENIFEYYFAIFPRLLQQIDVPFQMTIDGIATEEQPHVQAMREALVNMLMHADYFSASKPRVRVFTDHIEFYNPGGLPKDLETLRNADISLPRNPILAKMFRVIKLAETAGYGFDKIFGGWNTYSDDIPFYYNDIDFVTLSLTTKKPSVKGSVKSSVKTSVKIIELMKNNPNITIPKIAEQLDKSTRAIEKQIAKLQEQEKIRRTGPDKGGYWEIIM
ncbi:MAG: putative DNA binding domain-containing protein [Desulfobacterales bacterium]|nr:putative DNA binding domain-containing protein [Desulfobacterales bacterium]